MISIDGSFGEGGGQILRTALGLSLVTGQPFRIEKIRAGRRNPGLLRQHLTAVKAAAKIGQAEIAGVNIGSTQLTFTPGRVAHGDYQFAVGTAGSATLVLQTILPALLVSGDQDQQTQLTIEGGTHNPFAPPFDFLSQAFLPLLERMGVRVEARLERYGFYPAGGGRIEITIKPAKRLEPIELNERGKILNRRATALGSSSAAQHRRTRTGRRSQEAFVAAEMAESGISHEFARPGQRRHARNRIAKTSPKSSPDSASVASQPKPWRIRP